MCCAVLSRFTSAQLLVIMWTVVNQAPLSMGFSRPEYWSGNVLPCSPPGDLFNTGIKHMAPASFAMQVRFFTAEPPGKPCNVHRICNDVLSFISGTKN